MKFKFKITDDTTIEDAEKELENLYSAPVVDLPFNHVVKIAEFLGAKYGAQNEAYMSRSAEKWVRGLCFNELGVCG